MVMNIQFSKAGETVSWDKDTENRRRESSIMAGKARAQREQIALLAPKCDLPPKDYQYRESMDFWRISEGKVIKVTLPTSADSQLPTWLQKGWFLNPPTTDQNREWLKDEVIDLWNKTHNLALIVKWLREAYDLYVDARHSVMGLLGIVQAWIREAPQPEDEKPKPEPVVTTLISAYLKTYGAQTTTELAERLKSTQDRVRVCLNSHKDLFEKVEDKWQIRQPSAAPTTGA